MMKLTNTDKKVRELVGNEPNFAVLNHQASDFGIEYVKALNYVHYNVDETELKAELEKFLVSRKAEALVPYVGDLDGVQFSTLGKIAYCMNRGAELAPQSVLRIRNALEKVRDQEVAVVVKDTGIFEELEMTAAGKLNETYKNCYSRIDNVKARFLNGKIELTAVKGEVESVLEAQGAKAQVRKRLVQHYNQSLQEALKDKTIKNWVKPLQEIVSTLGGDVQEIKAKVKQVEAKAKIKPAAKDTAKAQTVKRLTKEVVKKAAKSKGTKTVTIKPNKDQGQPTVASQVRELIRTNKKGTTEAGMIEIVIRELGLSKERSRSVVKAFWSKVGA